MKTRENPLRNMARSALEQVFSDLSPKTQDELETAIVRQWITYDGHAGVCSVLRNAWFKLVKEGDGYHVGRTVCESRVPGLLRARGAREEEYPALIHRANLSQRAEFVGGDGQVWSLTIDPRERRVTVSKIGEESGDDGS
jgi:hypothetical protein